MSYADFIDAKRHLLGDFGFSPLWIPGFLFDFQRDLVEWSVRRGRAAIFADCGLGKTPMQLVWAQNVVQHSNRSVLIAAPLAVSQQIVAESEKFGVPTVRSMDGSIPEGASIVVTNYERLERFDPSRFIGMVCDESSILKNYNGKRRHVITQFMKKLEYRLLCTATAAPNDFTELGTSSEAIGELGHSDMLSRFFKNDQGHANARSRMYGVEGKWRFRGHAEEPFWRWVCSWARVIRRPSDMGYDDSEFTLPPLYVREEIIETKNLRDGMLFALPAVGLHEQREERRNTIDERCERVAEVVAHDRPALVWCHLNAEGDKLAKLIPDSVQVKGADSLETKESALMAFANGDCRVLVTKPSIGAWGLNFQHCAHVTFFPSHSYEQFYQAVRRCWRYGQTLPVTVDVIATDGDRGVLKNLEGKSERADMMFEALLAATSRATGLKAKEQTTENATIEVPIWMK